MKHLIKRNGPARAYCARPGCQASVEAWIVDRDVQALFPGDKCPSVILPFDSPLKEEELTEKQRIKYIVDYAKKEIRSWNKLIKYWNKHL